MKKISGGVLCFCCVVSLLTGCARDISSGSYEEATVGSVASTYACTVVSVRRVRVNGQDKLGNNGLGLAGGAIAGGVLGNAVGGGRGRTIATAVGALAGATAGAYAQKNLEEQVGLEYTVKLDNNGRLMTVVQGADNALHVGQPALLMVYPTGRSRLAPRY